MKLNISGPVTVVGVANALMSTLVDTTTLLPPVSVVTHR